MSPTDQLEHDLRDALRSEADAVVIAPDPWQRNVLLVATDGKRRSNRILVVAAAALVGVVVIGVLALGGPGATRSDQPARGSDDAFASENIRGGAVEAETLELGGQQTVHEIVLTDTTGDGPELCDRYRPADRAATDDASSGGGGCTPRVESADDDATAFDWLSGTTSGGDIHSVLAAVDSRVRKVSVWSAYGGETPARLHLTGWEGTKMMTVTVVGDASPPQRLVAYGHDEQVLEWVDLRDSFGEDWIPDNTCSVPETQPTQTDVGIQVVAGPSEAMLTPIIEGSDPDEQCLPLTSTIQGATAGSDAVVLVVAPEVAWVSVRGEGTDPVTEVPRRLPGSIWSYVVVHAPDGPDIFEPSDELTAYDAGGHVLDAVLVGGLT